MSPVLGPNDEEYRDFYFRWLDEQQDICKELRNELTGKMREDELRQLVQKGEDHYKHYYNAKNRAAKQDVLKMMHPSWRSPLEMAFLWIGGWRPTMIFQLAYAQAGQQVEAELADFLNDLDTLHMASLSSKQLSQVNNLQLKTHKAEEDLAHKEAIIQQSVADQPLLLLAQKDPAGQSKEHLEHENSISAVMDDKIKALEELMSAADELRFESLTDFLKILSTVQAAQYLVAAGDLHLAVREIGEQRERESSSPKGSQ